MESKRRILAFDIGIKNLAWCCGDVSGNFIEVCGWANENLLTGTTAEEEISNSKCETCKKKASYQKGNTLYCVHHCPPLTPALRDGSGTLLRTLPKVQVLKEISKSSGATQEQSKTKEACIRFLKEKFCFPKEKAAKVKSFDLEAIHDGIKEVVARNKLLFSSCSHIYLENQPAYKNPVMKSVQMMLFATLRDLLEGPPKVGLVHASRKTNEVTTKGDKGYKERKDASELRVTTIFKSNPAYSVHSEWFLKQKKRSDLADCFCMVVDAAAK